MPPQKNSGNRGAKRETGASKKNRMFIQDFMDDMRKEGHVEDVYIGRVLRRLGDKRMEVFYTQTVKDDQKGRVVQAKIPGKFSGKAKHSVYIDVGTFVAVANTGVSGSAEFEIVAVFSPDQMRDISKEFNLDPRVLAIDNTDSHQLVTTKMTSKDEVGYDFDAIQEEDEEDELDIDNI
jgi:hypothetical protein